MPVPSSDATGGRRLWIWLAPALIFVILAGLSLFVWRELILQQRALAIRHTEDICVQAARRLEVFIDSHLGPARVFAARWSSHEGRDFSRRRFEEFTSVLVQELAGYHAIALLSPDLRSAWVVPEGALDPERLADPPYRQVLEESGEKHAMLLSAPHVVHSGLTQLFAAQPLERDGESLGYLLLVFESRRLIDACFHQRIRSEFEFTVEDAGQLIFNVSPNGSADGFSSAAIQATQDFPVLNRTWRLSVRPLDPRSAGSDWKATLPVPIMGLLLSVGLAAVVQLLLRRVELHREAHIRAAGEMVQRKKAEQALQLLSRKVLMAQEGERARLSRELHDELGQRLTALRLELGWLKKATPEWAPDAAVALANSTELVEKAADELRALCKGLRPTLLDDLGLEPAVRGLVDEFEERFGIKTELVIQLDDDIAGLTPEVGLCTYRILQESLTNVGRHAQASTVRIVLQRAADELRLAIIDDGKGFSENESAELRGSGLAGMRERASLVNGTLETHSAPGKGTRVDLRVPLAKPVA